MIFNGALSAALYSSIVWIGTIPNAENVTHTESNTEAAQLETDSKLWHQRKPEPTITTHEYHAPYEPYPHYYEAVNQARY